jgi:hypothetical protein
MRWLAAFIVAIVVEVLSVGWLYPLWIAMTASSTFARSIPVGAAGGVPLTEKQRLVIPAMTALYRDVAIIWAAFAGFAWSSGLTFWCYLKGTRTARLDKGRPCT